METPLTQEQEIAAVEAAIDRERREGGAVEETKHARVRRGIYSMRAKPGRYVVRVRVPAGIITPPQLDPIADVVQKHAASGIAHLTTRQGIEIADVAGGEIGGILRRLEASGLTTRRTGGNVVRNIVCCPLAGIDPAEPFDVTPFALALDDYLRDHPDCQAFPRKIKIAFEGCPTDHVRTAACDIGLQAQKVGAEMGFQIRVAGGFGAAPVIGQVLEDFTPLARLVPTLEAILRVFNAHGNRGDRAHARMKWLVRSLGMDKFRELVLGEREKTAPPPPLTLPDVRSCEKNSFVSPAGRRPGASLDGKRLGSAPGNPGLLLARGGPTNFSQLLSEQLPRNIQPERSKGDSAPGFEKWKAFSAWPQKQEGAWAVWIRVPLGNAAPAQLRTISEAARRFSGAPLRLSVEQNILLRWVSEANLPELYRFLSAQGLGTCCAGQIMDVTHCVGSTACLSAITNSMAAARALEGLFMNGLGKHPRLRDLRIRVSGCPNSCSHHPAADIGLFGLSKRVQDLPAGRQDIPAPHYALLLGGRSDGKSLGRRMAEIPACRLAPAVERLLRSSLENSPPEQSFPDWASAAGEQRIRSLLSDLLRVPSPEESPEFYRDLEDTAEFKVQAKEGECSA